MDDLNYYLILIFLLSIIQSIFGLGLLILGTPILLFFDVIFIKILYIILPSSITVSLFNLIFISKLEKKYLSIKFLENFFLFCLPYVICGLTLVYFFESKINFQLLTGSIIIMTLLLKIVLTKKNYFYYANNNRKIINSLIGIIHGLTNVGGSFLALFLSTINKNNQSKTRIQITFIYFIFATTQYLYIAFVFKKQFNIPTINIIMISLFACVIGKILLKKINNNFFLKILYFLIFTSAISLILRSIKVL
jgi:uncharacterized membrane protein YfcA